MQRGDAFDEDPEGGAEIEPLDVRRDLRDLRRDAYENFRILAAVALEGTFYVLWVGIMIAIHVVLRLIGPLNFPFNIIPDIGELIVQFGVLYIIAMHTFNFVRKVQAHKRTKKITRIQGPERAPEKAEGEEEEEG